ncbi:MAG: hypothetical protein HY903_21320 [Deltaproteobacteria bacterium]|nr:hypothetical protein [Deltaproteobacteria bacterium]
MRRLSLLLALNVAVTSCIGLVAVDVAFTFWSVGEQSRDRLVALRTAATLTALEVGAEVSDPRPTLLRIAAEQQVEITLFGRDGSVSATATPAPALDDLAPEEHRVVLGYDYVARPMPPTSSFRRVVTGRRVDLGVTAGLALQRPLLGFLFVVGAAMTLAGWLFMRRSVLKPLLRMTELVSDNDRDGLSQFQVQTSGGLQKLSRAIVDMTARIDADRQQIAAQLADLQSAHDELRRTQATLVRAERLAVVGQLAAGLAHEIGNPLAVVSGFVGMLQGEGLSAAERADALQRVQRELDRIQQTVRDLLDFSRAPTKAGGVGDVREAVHHVARMVAPQQRLQGVRLEVDAQTPPAIVPLDAAALTQVLLNLVLNAADALGGSGQIRINVRTAPTSVVIEVDDSGPGVPDELKARVFEPFFTTKPAGKGTGLGLAVCDGIIGAAGGTLAVLRSPLGGARFRVTLPVARSPE